MKLNSSEAREQIARLGYQVDDIAALALDQRPFAQRVCWNQREIQPGLKFTSRVIELGGGAFTNVYELRWRSESGWRLVGHSASEGRHLVDTLTRTSAAAAGACQAV